MASGTSNPNFGTLKCKIKCHIKATYGFKAKRHITIINLFTSRYSREHMRVGESARDLMRADDSL